MDRWKNKTAVVTGGSSGVGAACVLDLAKSGMIVAALGRREHNLIELRNSLPEDLRKNVHPIKCDVTNESEVIEAFKWIENHLGVVHILINSAGTAYRTELCGLFNTREIKNTIDTNVLGTAFCVREAFNQMKGKQIDGHIVLLNSNCGHYVPVFPIASVNIYAASKFAVTAMAETYRQEFSAAGTNVKITSISPGAVNSGVFPSSLRDLVDFAMLKSENVSNAIMFCISTPPHVQIHELTIRPLHEKF